MGAELNGKIGSLDIGSLDRANNDLRNLFDGTHIATVFLDKHFSIRSSMPAVGETFILPSDRVGRSPTC